MASMRRRRQRAAAISFASSVSSPSAGLKRFRMAASSASYSSCDSWGRTTRALLSPCFRLFWADLAFPSAVTGPFDFAPLLRAASALVDTGILRF